MSVTSYRNDLRSVARGYWLGLWTDDQFMDLMFSAIDRGLRSAWMEGAKDIGIAPDEVTPNEQVMLTSLIFREYSFVSGLATYIFQNNQEISKLTKQNLTVTYSRIIARVEVWVNRYKDVVNRAKVVSEKNPKLKWVLGRTKETCETCGKLAGKVRRADWWEENVMPQQPPNPALQCQGWKCGCSLEMTTDPMSRGRMPSTP